MDTTTSSRFREFSDRDIDPLLHGLATIARIKDRIALVPGNYTRILDIDPSDQVAKTNQAFLLAEEESP